MPRTAGIRPFHTTHGEGLLSPSDPLLHSCHEELGIDVTSVMLHSSTVEAAKKRGRATPIIPWHSPYSNVHPEGHLIVDDHQTFRHRRPSRRGNHSSRWDPFDYSRVHSPVIRVIDISCGSSPCRFAPPVQTPREDAARGQYTHAHLNYIHREAEGLGTEGHRRGRRCRPRRGRRPTAAIP